VENVKPRAWYRGLFPEQQFDLERLAYYFDADWKDILGPTAYDDISQVTTDWVDRWSNGAPRPDLVFHDSAEGGLEIVDTRNCRRQTFRLDQREERVYRTITEQHHTVGGILNQLSQDNGNGFSQRWVADLLDQLVGHGLVLQENGWYLALAVPAEAPEPWLGVTRQETAAAT